MNDLPPEVVSQIADFFKRLVNFETGASHACPACGREVTSARLYPHIEPESNSLYVDPCGCRLGIWKAAPEWIIDVEIIPLDFDEEPTYR